MVYNPTTSTSESGDFSARKADIVDKYVGMRLKERRIFLHLSQKDIAHAIGVSYQQIQKYECGNNRLSAGRLFMLAYIMKVDVGYFYEGLPDIDDLKHKNFDDIEHLAPDLASISNRNVRTAIKNLLKVLQESELL